MIDAIRLKHFKCFKDLRLPLPKLTLLTGHNATGKSSTIQSLLLLHQTAIQRDTLLPPFLSSNLILNGESAALGTFGDVLDTASGRDSFEIGIELSEGRIDWNFKSNDKNIYTAPLSDFRLFGGRWRLAENSEFTSRERQENALGAAIGETLRKILHVSTERIGPRETYEADLSEESGLRLGARGEYSAWFLHRNGENLVDPLLRLPGIPPTLARQTEAWLAHFFPGTSLQIERVKGTRLVALRFRTSIDGQYHRPENVGYGLTHILPVLIGGLGADVGQTFIVENPEAHLHPSAQAEIGQFLAMVAAKGSQVVIESHSDHVLNGLRRAVKRGSLPSELVAIHYFDKRNAPGTVTSPSINSKGEIDHWPSGFFDQYESDLDELTGW